MRALRIITFWVIGKARPIDTLSSPIGPCSNGGETAESIGARVRQRGATTVRFDG